jgi:integrase
MKRSSCVSTNARRPGRQDNRRGRPFSANKPREKLLHPLVVKLGIPRGGFHAARHGATNALLADGATPAVVQKQLRHSAPRITLGIYGHVIGNQQRGKKLAAQVVVQSSILNRLYSTVARAACVKIVSERPRIR